ncbi:hypothetical protein [Branchiibius cervicis]|uniref:Uncharacterized protein n=1 Tax=Branchiibius cervicis TaxID=908252 RepID=A0ABW2AS11_9MICO
MTTVVGPNPVAASAAHADDGVPAAHFVVTPVRPSTPFQETTTVTPLLVVHPVAAAAGDSVPAPPAARTASGASTRAAERENRVTG